MEARLAGHDTERSKLWVRWNSPFCGVEGAGWFLSFHVFTRYVKVTFFQGSSLDPTSPGGTAKSGNVRWIDVHKHDGLDEARMANCRPPPCPAGFLEPAPCGPVAAAPACPAASFSTALKN